jgi:predicted anti-sigma-YlaC factor YlaD
MALVQYIYTSILITELTAQNAYDTSAMSTKVCQQFGITGRVFANRQKALAITEGEEEIVKRYFESVANDPMAGNILLHVKRSIPIREFADYSVWLNLGQTFEFSQYVRELTPQSLHQAWPTNLSAKVRIMADAYLDPEMLAA